MIFPISEGNEIAAAAVANVEADGDSVTLRVDHVAEGIYICECRFSKITLMHGVDKYMVSNILSTENLYKLICQKELKDRLCDPLPYNAGSRNQSFNFFDTSVHNFHNFPKHFTMHARRRKGG